MQPMLGGYRLLRLLGSGGMGDVFLAERHGPERFVKQVALKQLHPHRSRNADTVASFLDEARITARLVHPHIAQVLELGEDGGRFFITMEYVSGPSLRTLLDATARTRTLLPAWLSGWVMARVLTGLAHAHALRDEQGNPLGLVHRDLSPENVMVGRHGTVKVTDFGLAKAFLSQERRESGAVRGKADYMPPEQLRGQPLDARADVFACGRVLEELLKFAEPREEMQLRLAAIARDAQAITPEERPASAADMAEQLDAAIGARALEAVAALDALLDGLDVAGGIQTEARAPTRPTEALRTPSAAARPRRYFKAGLAGVGLLALAGGVAFALRPARPTPLPPSGVTTTRLPSVTAPARPAVEPRNDEALAPPPHPDLAPKRHAPLGPRVGQVVVRANPWAEVWVDGRNLGTTPMEPLSLAAGNHVVTFKNPVLRTERSFRVLVKPGGRAVLKAQLRE